MNEFTNTERVSYQHLEGVAQITLDDGKANVISIAMQKDINAALDQAEKDGGVLLITGKPNLFSGGFDLGVFKAGDLEKTFAMVAGGMKLADRLYRFPMPVVAAVTGHAVAMGVFLTLAADYRIGCNNNAKLVANEVAIGMTMPYYAVELCREKLTPNAFNCAVTLAEIFSGDAAVQAGFLDQITEPEQVLVTAQKKARQILTLDLDAHRSTKLRSRAAGLARLEAALEKDYQSWQNRRS